MAGKNAPHGPLRRLWGRVRGQDVPPPPEFPEGAPPLPLGPPPPNSGLFVGKNTRREPWYRTLFGLLADHPATPPTPPPNGLPEGIAPPGPPIPNAGLFTGKNARRGPWYLAIFSRWRGPQPPAIAPLPPLEPPLGPDGLPLPLGPDPALLAASNAQREPLHRALLQGLGELRFGLPGADRINMARLATTFVAAAALLAALAAWRNFQLGRTGQRMLETAQARETEGDLAGAARGYAAFLKLFPERADVHWTLTQCLDRGAATLADKQRAIAQLRVAMRNPGEHQQAAALRLAELLWDVGQYREAIGISEAILSRAPQNARAWRVKGLALAHRQDAQLQVDSAELIRALERAAGLNPQDLLLAASLAGHLRRDGNDARRADEVMQRLVDLRADDPQAWMARFAYRVLFALPGADDDLSRAIELAPEGVEILLAAGARFRQQRNWPAAQGAYEKLVELQPDGARGYLGLALTAVGRGDEAQAAAIAERGLRASPDDPWLLAQWAEWLLDLGRGDEADRAIDQLAQLIARNMGAFPRHQIDALTRSHELLQARRLMLAGKLAPAIDALRKLAVKYEVVDAVQNSTQRVQVHTLLAACLERQEDWMAVAQQCDLLTKIQPDQVRRWVNAGQAWQRAGQPGRAIRSYEKALEMEPSLEAVRAELNRIRPQTTG